MKSDIEKLSLEDIQKTMTKEEIDKEFKRIMRERKKTVLPYDPMTQSYTKPPEWDDEMWRGYVFGYDPDED
jgi:hypothetical protein